MRCPSPVSHMSKGDAAAWGIKCFDYAVLQNQSEAMTLNVTACKHFFQTGG